MWLASNLCRRTGARRKIPYFSYYREDYKGFKYINEIVMGSLDNRLRKKWQDYGGKLATVAEHSFYEVFDALFEGTSLMLIRKPGKFSKIYVNQKLDADEMNEIYIPAEKISRHGIQPDCIIRNNDTGKEIYVEIKRQDGWVEGKKRSAGRGNAHERFCKYFTPGLLKLMRKEGNIDEPNLPFWIVFQGDITRDICHVREIRFWFDGNRENVTFWRNTHDAKPLIDHFISKILPLLE